MFAFVIDSRTDILIFEISVPKRVESQKRVLQNEFLIN